MTAETYQWKEHFAPIYKWRLLSDFWLNDGFSPQEASVATLCRVLPRQRLDLFTNILSPRKFAECLYCDITPPPILPVLSRFIEFTCHMQLYSRTVIYSLYSHTNHIHSYIRHIYTFIHRYFHIFIHIIYTASFTHDYISHPESCFGHVSSVRSLLVIVSSPKFLQRNILNLPSCHQKCHPQCVWSRDVTHYKPGGFRQFFFTKPSGLWRTPMKSFIKPSGFSQMFIKKPGGFSLSSYQAEWILANVYQAEWILANLL